MTNAINPTRNPARPVVRFGADASQTPGDPIRRVYKAPVPSVLKKDFGRKSQKPLTGLTVLRNVAAIEAREEKKTEKLDDDKIQRLKQEARQYRKDLETFNAMARWKQVVFFFKKPRQPEPISLYNYHGFPRRVYGPDPAHQGVGMLNRELGLDFERADVKLAMKKLKKENLLHYNLFYIKDAEFSAANIRLTEKGKAWLSALEQAEKILA